MAFAIHTPKFSACSTRVFLLTTPRSLPPDTAGLALVAETLAAGIAHGAELWFGTPANVGRLLSRAANELGLAVHIATT